MNRHPVDELRHAPREDGAYMPHLDALRFFAALGVLFTHMWHPRGLPWLLNDLALEWASLGVRLFFVLSGFLITGILLDCRVLADTTTQSPLSLIRRFYARRFLRIFPVYYLMIAIGLVADLPPAREIWVWLMTYTSNVYIAGADTWIGRFGHFWTLAVEEQFYLLWPWVVLFAPRPWITRAAVLLIVVAPLYRGLAYLGTTFDIGAMDFKAATFTLASLDTLGAGALLAVVWRSEMRRDRLAGYLYRRVLPAGLALYIAVLIAYHHRIAPGVFFTFADTASAMIFVWMIDAAARGFRGPARLLLSARPVRYLGKISYGLYVYHTFTPLLAVPIAALLGMSVPVPGFTNFLFSGALTVLVAAISWELFESPINGLKRRFPYAVVPSVEPAAAGSLAPR